MNKDLASLTNCLVPLGVLTTQFEKYCFGEAKDIPVVWLAKKPFLCTEASDLKTKNI
jgi:hypothetical protein